MPSSERPLHWGKSTVETACPLDCPDSCTLAVSVEEGRVVSLDGGRLNPTTGGYICAKVRAFGQRVYGESRLLHPAVRIGAKGRGAFKQVSWEEALAAIADRMRQVREQWGGEAILPYYYGGSNGLVTQGTTDFELFRGIGASRLARTLCAAPTGAAAEAMYGKMAGVAYEDYPEAQLIVMWGANPAISGIHLMPFVKQARARGAKLVVVDPRTTSLGRQADVHLRVRPGTDLPVALAIHRYLFEHGYADEAFLAAHATGAAELRTRAAEWTMDRAAEVAGVEAGQLEEVAALYATTAPAVVRCGWGLERNRNGGSAVMAVLALPAVAGKFGVRGGGYTMSNSAAWKLSPGDWVRTPEPSTRIVNMNRLGRALLEYDTPPVKLLFVYNCNPAVTAPAQNKVLKGLEREDLFTVVFDQVMTDSAKYADVVLPATTFLEAYDLARGYGAYSLQLVKPAIDVVGESRPNAEVFSELAVRLGVSPSGDIESDGETLLRVTAAMPEDVREAVLAGRQPLPPGSPRPVQFVDVHPGTPNGKAQLCPEAADAATPYGLYAFQPDPRTEEYPLALISPSTHKTVNSTLGELRAQPAALHIHPQAARARGIEDGDTVRVYNEHGEVHCAAFIDVGIEPTTVSLAKGLWRHSTLNESTSNALVPDTLTNLGAGACFNDARVEVVRVLTAALEDKNLSLWVAGPTKRVN